MASERVARIERGYEAWNRGEALPSDDVSPDFEFHPPPDLSGESVQRGLDAGDEFRQGLDDAFESVRVTLLDTSELGGDQVLARVRIEAAGRHTGIEMSREEFHLCSFEGELLRSMWCFVDEGEAIAAAREQEGPGTG